MGRGRGRDLRYAEAPCDPAEGSLRRPPRAPMPGNGGALWAPSPPLVDLDACDSVPIPAEAMMKEALDPGRVAGGFRGG